MIAALARLLGRPLLRADDPSRDADAIVVLGSLLRPDGSLSPVGEERVAAGVALLKAGRAPLLVLTGSHPAWAIPGRGASPITEAEAMAARAREHGVPDAALVLEKGSRSTYENARGCAALLAPRGVRRVWIVTQPFHLRRATRQFRAAGFDALGFHIEDSLQYRNPPIGLRWVLYEYVSWMKLAARAVVGGPR